MKLLIKIRIHSKSFLFLTIYFILQKSYSFEKFEFSIEVYSIYIKEKKLNKY